MCICLQAPAAAQLQAGKARACRVCACIHARGVGRAGRQGRCLPLQWGMGWGFFGGSGELHGQQDWGGGCGSGVRSIRGVGDSRSGAWGTGRYWEGVSARSGAMGISREERAVGWE